ncbi:Dph6-related ATP pyrophosphatase [Archaeoglobus neptunius]|uniref:Dph6-related ATP pyrophosphatase n=1 Tax=Archaeoglobus neptunius TaxID=2798580 RepID=UPI00192519AD|nr:diphthine--ammonia ligase [Archaeoglobus neptunius]
MTTVAMWSGGKDSCLAVWRALKEEEVNHLICMMQHGKARAHGINAEVVKAQEKCIGINMVLEETTWEEYERRLKSLFGRLGVRKAIFGDIYLEEHKLWIERVCSEVDVRPVFPLWGENTRNLAEEFINAGFEAYVIAAKKEFRDLLGRRFDSDLVDELIRRNIDPCGEDGEFHTLVVDGPLFRRRLEFSFTEPFESEKYWHFGIKV